MAITVRVMGLELHFISQLLMKLGIVHEYTSALKDEKVMRVLQKRSTGGLFNVLFLLFLGKTMNWQQSSINHPDGDTT